MVDKLPKIGIASRNLRVILLTLVLDHALTKGNERFTRQVAGGQIGK